MSYYAYYRLDLSSGPRVIGWYDDSVNGNLPADGYLLSVTLDQWDARMTNPSGWAVEDGQLVEWIPPPPPAPPPPP